MIEQLQAILAIALIDLALSGDNALVIGLAARGLPPAQRRRAVLLGGTAAVVLRVAAASAVTLLLRIPYLQLVAGIVLVVIAYRLVRPAPEHAATPDRPAPTTMREAVLTILVADAVMSLENVLGVGAAAHGSIALLIFGLALSIPIVLVGSNVVARLVQRFPWGIWLGAYALVWTSAGMILHEPALGEREWPAYMDPLVSAILLVIVAAVRLAAHPSATRERAPRRAQRGSA